jgi:hypothetical protein
VIIPARYAFARQSWARLGQVWAELSAARRRAKVERLLIAAARADAAYLIELTTPDLVLDKAENVRLRDRLREFDTREEVEPAGDRARVTGGWCDLCNRSLDVERRHGHAADCLLASEADVGRAAGQAAAARAFDETDDRIAS